MATIPTDPKVVAAAEACLKDLRMLVKTMQKAKFEARRIGVVKDNINSLELVLKYGSFGGKCPWPVGDDSLAVFQKHGIEDLIHAPWKARHQARLIHERAPEGDRRLQRPSKENLQEPGRLWFRRDGDVYWICLGPLMGVRVLLGQIRKEHRVGYFAALNRGAGENGPHPSRKSAAEYLLTERRRRVESAT